MLKRAIPCLIALLTCAVTSSSKQADWNVLLFADARSDLECSALRNIAELSGHSPAGRVNYVVEVGRPDVTDGCPGFPYWTGVRRFRIEPSATFRRDSDWGENLGPIDMGSADSLYAFVKWTRYRYPARRNALIIWGHHNLADADAGGTFAVRELGNRLKAALQGERLDILGFDACRMADLDVADSVRKVATLFIASEEDEPAAGWNYEALARRLSISPGIDAQTLASGIVADYGRKYPASDPLWSNVTLAAVRLKPIAQLTSFLSRFSGDATNRFDPHLAAAVRAARGRTPGYGLPNVRNSIDLAKFLLELQRQAGVPSVVNNDGLEITKLIQGSILLRTYRSPLDAATVGSYGLSIDFPNFEANTEPPPVNPSSSAGWHRNWTRFLSLCLRQPSH